MPVRLSLPDMHWKVKRMLKVAEDVLCKEQCSMEGLPRKSVGEFVVQDAGFMENIQLLIHVEKNEYTNNIAYSVIKHNS